MCISTCLSTLPYHTAVSFPLPGSITPPFSPSYISSNSVYYSFLSDILKIIFLGLIPNPQQYHWESWMAGSKQLLLRASSLVKSLFRIHRLEKLEHQFWGIMHDSAAVVSDRPVLITLCGFDGEPRTGRRKMCITKTQVPEVKSKTNRERSLSEAEPCLLCTEKKAIPMFRASFFPLL